MAIPNYLPPEFLSKILTFLPPKSLLRFVSASKSWYNLITHPVFISSHLNQQICATTQNPNPPLFLSEGGDQHSIWRDGQDFANRTLLECPWKKQNALTCYAANSCNGLVCMFTSNKEIFLWNPSIRKYMKVEPAPVEGFDSLSIAVGLGFDSANNDYKVVAITYYEVWPSKIIVPAPSSYAQIYSVNTGVWRNIRYPYRDRGTKCFRSQVFFNGVIHWIIHRMSVFAEDNEDDCTLILTFNLKSEVFGVLKLPSCIRDISYPNNVSLGVVKDSIALYFQCFGEGCRIFLMKDCGEDESWACFYNIELPEERVTALCLRNSHELLVSRQVLGFLYLYAPQELHCLHTYISEFVRPFPCLESLVLLNKLSKPSWCKVCERQGRLALLKGSQ